MKKNFISFILFSFIALVFSSSVFAAPCSTCHDSALLGSLDFESEPLVIVQADKSEASEIAYTQESTFYAVNIPSPYFAFTRSDYVEKPGNPITDEENLFRTTIANSQGIPDTIPRGSIYFTNAKLESARHGANE